MSHPGQFGVEGVPWPPLPDRTELAGQRAGGAAGGSGREGLRALARAGLVARGVVYGVIGVLALKLALGSGGKTTSQTGALQTIASEPFGEVLLVALAIGLGAYALWSPDRRRRGLAARR